MGVVASCVTTRYLPNLNHLARLLEVDRCVVLDLAPIPDRNKNSFVNRNLIVDQRTDSKHWLTLPIQRDRGLEVRNVVLAPTEKNWRRKHIGSISHFYPSHNSIAPGFLGQLEAAFETGGNRLLDINMEVLRVIFATLKIETCLPTLQSTLAETHTPYHRADIAEIVGASEYRAGVVEIDVLCEEELAKDFSSRGILVTTSKELPETKAPEEIFVRVSCLHAILTLGPSATRDLLLEAVNELRSRD